MVIRRVSRDTFDVFMAKEFWGDWTRVRVGGRNGVYGVAGRRLSNKQLQEIAEQVK